MVKYSIQVVECGVVISSTMPSLPDRRMMDNIFGYGILEIKCPFYIRNLTPKKACFDPSFYCYIVNVSLNLTD